MSNTEKLIKKLNENKEIRKLKEQKIKMIQLYVFKNALITLVTDLLVNKKLKHHYLKICYH